MIIAILLGCSMLAGVLPPAWSDGGDIIIVRKVEPRTAFRPGTGPVTAKANPGGTVAHELTDNEFANVASGVPMQTGTLAARSAGMAGTRNDAAIGMGGSLGLNAGSMMNSGMGSAGGTAGAMAQQATGQVMDALKGIGLIGSR
ncbi:MAG TPA: hypothetical protein VFW88_04690 [Burkholderiales bacterium]|nr:hypothetical protein [Burkholderiales bacterium]